MHGELPSERPRRILVVDDDTRLREEVCAYLLQHDFEARGEHDGRGMDAALSAEQIDLIILDVMMPGEDGLSICRRLLDIGGPPVFIVSAMANEIDRVLGLELGADDYLPKPFSRRELLARVRALLRRLESRSDGESPQRKSYTFQGFVLNALNQQLRAPDGTTVILTRNEYLLLKVFVDHPQRILTREDLIELSRGAGSQVLGRAIDVQISRLRLKLHGLARDGIIRTYRGAGSLRGARKASMRTLS